MSTSVLDFYSYAAVLLEGGAWLIAACACAALWSRVVPSEVRRG